MSNRSDELSALRDAPAYTVSEASKYARLPTATLRSWVVGREYEAAGARKHFSPLITPAARSPIWLSFLNLIEAHVLRALRVQHSVSVKSLRAALDYAQSKLGVERLLLSPDLRTDAGRVFLDRYGELIDLSASGQLAMRKLLEAHLSRVEWDNARFPVRLYPFVTEIESSRARPILIDPQLSFGRPIVARTGVTTAAIVGRLDAGESVAEIAEDYDLKRAEVEQAALYERAA